MIIWLCWYKASNTSFLPLIALSIALFFIASFGKDLPGIHVFSKIQIFLFGVIAASIPNIIQEHANKIPALQIATLFIVLILALYHPNSTTMYLDYPFAILVALFILINSYETGLSRLLYANQPIQFIGKASFSIYLTHEIVYYFTLKFLLSMNIISDVIVIPFIIIAAVLFGSLMYLFLEIPLNNRFKKLLMHLYEKKSKHTKQTGT